MNDLIVVINAGSATVKFALYAVCDNGTAARLFNRGSAEFNAAGAGFNVVDEHSAIVVNESIPTGSGQALDIHVLLDRMLHWLKTFASESIVALGHRVVHGGDAFSEPILLTDAILLQLETYVALAPLHQPFNLAAIRAIRKLWPDIPQVACFDTAFHQTQPRVARMFGLPLEYFDQGVKRYGFHGLSYEFIASALPEYLGELSDGRVSWRIWAAARACAPCNGAGVSPAPWDLPPWMAC